MGEAAVVDLNDAEGEALWHVHLHGKLAVLAEVRRPGTYTNRGEVTAVDQVEGGVPGDTATATVPR